MSDIKIPTESSKQAEFSVKSLVNNQEKSVGVSQPEPSDKIRVKFDKFVQLVATHDFGGVLKKYGDEDVVISSNLLTDLASAHEEVETHPTKIPIWIISGIIIGIILTYIILRP